MTESLDQQLTKLVEAGWHVIESDFDTAAFLTWREAAVKCLNELMGPEFERSRNSRELSDQAESRRGVVAGQAASGDELPPVREKRFPEA